jgi:uncharacterized protein DUF4190
MNLKNCITAGIFGLIVVLLSSCADTGIMKRRYMPGYYINKSARSGNPDKVEQEQNITRNRSSVSPVETVEAPSDETIIQPEAGKVSDEKSTAPLGKKADLLKKHRHLIIEPFGEKNKEEPDDTSRDAPFDPFAIAAFTLSLIGMLLLILALVAGTAVLLWVLAIVLVIMGLVYGLKSRRQINESGDRGIGLAIAAIVMGIISLVLIILGLTFILFFVLLFGV